MGKASRSAILKSKLHKAGFKPERQTFKGKRVWVLDGIVYQSLTQMVADLRNKKLLKIE